MWSPGKEKTESLDRRSLHTGAPSLWLALSGGRPVLSYLPCRVQRGTGMGTGYLVPFVAPPSTHPIGPHGGEEGQVVAIGLCQEHRLSWVQGEAGTGVPLLRNSGDTDVVGAATGWACWPSQTCHPAPCLWGLCPPPRPWLRGLYEYPMTAITDCHVVSGLKHTNLLSYSSGGQTSDMGLIGLRSRCQQDWLLLEALARISSPCTSQLLGATCTPWLMALVVD